jgi:elongation factor 1-beta
LIQGKRLLNSTALIVERYLFGDVKDAEDWQGLINVKIAVLKALRWQKLGSIIVRVKILPESIDMRPEELLKKVADSVSSVAKVQRHRVEPIAFGLNALIVDFAIEDAEGGTDPLEEAISKVNGVGSMEVIGVSRASTKL